MFTEGTIFEVREFSLFDGPGIRTTVFFKGCPLKCLWCQNPEGQSPEIEILYNSNRCTHCGTCHRTDSDNPYIFSCPSGAKRVCGQIVTVSTLVAQLVSQKSVFDSSGGGVTFSGGDPLFQPDFAFELASALKNEGIHVAIETSGFASLETYKHVVEQVDLVFQDLKHACPDVHQQLTGVDNRPIINNISWLKTSGKPYIIRIPLIPGCNNSESALFEMAKVISNNQGSTDKSGLIRVELLPFHRTAGAKYPLLGRTWQPPFNEENPPRGADNPVEIFRQFNIPVQQM